MIRDMRNPSATRIAVTLGAVVAAVMLAIWGASAIAGTMHAGLKPEPKPMTVAARIETRTAAPATTTVSAPATSTSEPTQPVAPPKPAPKPSAPVVASKPAAKYVVVVDPGHGGELRGTEPIGPWAGAEQKVKTQSGANGEADIVLKVGLKLRPLLEAQGVKVIMTRTAPAALSNVDRAKIANDAHADLFLRLHCDGIDNSSAHGISMLVPSASKGWAPIAPSRKAGETILSALVRQTGANDRGIQQRADMTGFNWSKVPTALPEMGFVSNPSENAKLKSDSYQNTLAKALADGTMAYLRTVR